MVNVAQLLVTIIAVLLIVTPLLLLAFVAGRRSSVAGSHRRFDRLRSEIVLGVGAWRAEIDGDDIDSTQSILLELRQVGSRIIGAGQSPDGTSHALEGILFERRLSCVTIDENRTGVWLGTVTAELFPGEQRMVGMRSRWSPTSQTLMVRKIILTRIQSSDPAIADAA